MHDDDEIGEYSMLVGQRLRAIRKQKRLSLHDVEAESDQEFKASVLGAYERGERSLSLPRLDRLARFYRVPVSQLLPQTAAESDALAGHGKVLIDLDRLSKLPGAPFDMLARFLRMIEIQRRDFNGRVLTVRADDHRAISAILDVPVDQVHDRLESFGLLYRPVSRHSASVAGQAPITLAGLAEPSGNGDRSVQRAG